MVGRKIIVNWSYILNFGKNLHFRIKITNYNLCCKIMLYHNSLIFSYKKKVINKKKFHTLI